MKFEDLLNYILFWIFLIVLGNIIALLFVVSTANAVNVTLSWDASPSENSTQYEFLGYKVYYKTGTTGIPYNGTDATEGTSPITVGNVLTYTLTDLSMDDIYYFVVTAYARTSPTSIVESTYSNEVNNGVPSRPINLEILSAVDDTLQKHNISIERLAFLAMSYVINKTIFPDELLEAVQAVQGSIPEYIEANNLEICRVISNAYEMIYNNDDATILIAYN